MESYYARRAQEYERIYAKPERQEDLRTLRGIVEESFRGKHVLEIACGTGYWTEVLAGSAASVTAVDINEEVLDVARAKSLKAKFSRADVYALPQFPEKFEAGLAAFWWSHVPKARLRSFLTDFHRAFTPGATIVFIDNIYVEGSSTPISRTDSEGNTYQMRKLDDGSTHEVLKNFPTDNELRNAPPSLEACTKRQKPEISLISYVASLRIKFSHNLCRLKDLSGFLPSSSRLHSPLHWRVQERKII